MTQFVFSPSPSSAHCCAGKAAGLWAVCRAARRAERDERPHGARDSESEGAPEAGHGRPAGGAEAGQQPGPLTSRRAGVGPQSRQRTELFRVFFLFFPIIIISTFLCSRTLVFQPAGRLDPKEIPVQNFYGRASELERVFQADLPTSRFVGFITLGLNLYFKKQNKKKRKKSALFTFGFALESASLYRCTFGLTTGICEVFCFYIFRRPL